MKYESIAIVEIEQNIVFFWSQRSCKGQLGLIRGQFVYEHPMTTKFGGKNSYQELSALLGSKVT